MKSVYYSKRLPVQGLQKSIKRKLIELWTTQSPQIQRGRQTGASPSLELSKLSKIGFLTNLFSCEFLHQTDSSEYHCTRCFVFKTFHEIVLKSIYQFFFMLRMVALKISFGSGGKFRKRSTSRATN